MILPIRINFGSQLSLKQRLISNAQDMGYFRNIKYLSTWINKGYLIHAEDTETKDAAISFLENFILAINEVYGNKWDIYPKYVGYEDSYRLSCIIHYDKFTITNTPGDTHEIRDMLIRLDFGFGLEDEYVISSMYGGRNKVYAFENSGYPYMHSHLSTATLPSRDDIEEMKGHSIFYDFCTNGNEMEVHLDEMATTDEVLEKEELELFFYTMDSFLKWESLEGTPYRKISYLRRESGQGENVTNGTPSTYELETYLRTHPSEFNLIYAQGTYKILIDQSFKQVCKDYLISNLPHTRQALVMKEGMDLMCLPKNLNQIILRDVKYLDENGVPFHIKIQGRQYDFAVLKNNFGFEEEKVKIENYFVHPKSLENVCKRIEQTLFEQYAEREFIKAKLEGDYA